MNLKRIFVILFVLLLIPFTIKLRGEEGKRIESLFTDIKANRVGDILTVMIYEQSQATQKSESKTEKSSSTSASGGPGVGSLDFIPLFGMDFDNSNTFDGKGENTRNGTLTARMSVTVMSVLPNGDLVIEGTRTVGISGDRETLALTGVVRQKDISPDNTVDSYLIADAEIHYTGKGNANTASRPGFLSRLFGWLF
ncbi:MAG: flagellar basal body L-ring protein FlgH [bacterium]